MQRALDLAAQGLGSVEPNPPVGAVVVDESGTLLGEGHHEAFGGPHAEINAIASAGDACAGATLYVTLEPCAHHGKTPPCSDAVIAAGFRKVVIASSDPIDHRGSSGIEQLKAAGIEVEVGLLESQARRLIAPFVCLQEKRRPYVHGKWAMTLDGRIASGTGHSQWISNETSRAVVHQLRGRMDAVIVGIGTVLADDPLLTARPPGPRTATRIVFDSQGRTPADSKLVKTASESPVLIVLSEEANESAQQRLEDHGVKILRVPSSSDQSAVDVESVLCELGRREMMNVLVEGGSRVLGSFFDAGLIDECHVFIAPKIVGGRDALSPIAGTGLDRIPEVSLETEVELLDGDVYLRSWLA